MFLLIFLTLGAGFVGWICFLWAVKSGQYDDIERPKYRMLEDEEEKGEDKEKKEGKEEDEERKKD
ncbi:MAG TPA: cbb3-type cytochrome oxidase assembly protein CcoS [Nitrospirota bacterium]|nr:cbb3-type cytochrome oxidase assembly protein CcoS [Nitrospirota bacterium]